MNKLLKITLCISFCLISACEDHDKTPPEFYVLNTELSTGQLLKGFSFKDLKIITFPNSSNVIPDFILACHTNETGDIIGPMLSHPNLENRFIFLKSYDNITSAQNHFDTLSVIGINPFQTFALDIKPFEIWQIKTNSGETGILLILETRTETKNNTPFAEIKFKAKINIP
ncbi:MAG: hypothetical protein JXR67_00450 [Bacteroidales bacterium]|nr:hypothetical protein [Bacteroidales bacterium]